MHFHIPALHALGNLFEVAGCAGQERVRRARFNLYEIVNASKNVAICTILTRAKRKIQTETK